MSFPISFPSAIDSLDTLLEVKNALINTLASDISASDTSLTVNEVITSYPDKGFLKYDAEILEYHAKNDGIKTFSSLVRGADGTTATSHSAGATGRLCNAARYRQILVDLSLAFLRKIGVVSASEPSYDGGNEAGDKWVDTSGASPVLKMHDGANFVEIGGGGGGAVNQYNPAVTNEALSAGVLKTVSFSGAGNAAVPEVGKVVQIKVNKNGGGTVANPIYIQFYKTNTFDEANAVSGHIIFELTVANEEGDYISIMDAAKAFVYDLGAGNSTIYARVICATAFNIDILLTIEEQARGA